MNVRTLSTALAFSAAMLLGTSADGSTTPEHDTTLGGGNADNNPAFKWEYLRDDGSSLGGGDGNTQLGAQRIIEDPSTDDDLLSPNRTSLFKVMTVRYIPIGYKFLRASLR